LKRYNTFILLLPKKDTAKLFIPKDLINDKTMVKQGQVTMFIILGIILLFVIIGSVFLRDEVSKRINKLKISQSAVLHEQTEEARDIVEYCLVSVTENAVLRIAAYGGYNRPPKNAVDYEYYTVPLYFDKGKENVPKISDIEKAVAERIEEELQDCTDFGKLHFSAEPSREPSARVSISKDEVGVELEWPIKVGNEETGTVTISDFSASVKANIPETFEKTVALYKRQKDFKVVSLIDLARLAKEKDYILHFDVKDDAMLYILTFNKTIIKEQPLVYTFGIKA